MRKDRYNKEEGGGGGDCMEQFVRLCLVLYTGGGVLVWQGIVAVAGDRCG